MYMYTGNLRITALTIVFAVFLATFSVSDTSTPSEFIKDFNGYMNVCQRFGWEPKKGCSSVSHVIAFHAAIKSHLSNVPVNTTIQFEDVLLNKGNGYDPKTGVFTAPEDGVYFFEWTFITSKGSSVYIEAMVDGVGKASTCVHHQQSNHISASGHLLYELMTGNKVWIRTFNVAAGYMHADKYTYFSGYKLSYF